MSELGNLLRKARSEKGIDLDALQDSTKIQKRYLEAIENGKYEVLPGNFYVRAFIKSYSEAVGLDPNEVIRMYRDELPNTSLPRTEVIPQKRKRKFNSDRFSKWITTILMWSFPLIIAAAFYIYFTKFHEPKPVPDNHINITNDFAPIEEPKDHNDIALPEPEDDPVEEDVPPPELEVEYVVTDGVTYVYNVSHTEMLKLELRVIGEKCWIQLLEDNKDGAEIAQANIYKGDVQTWETDRSLWLRMGNPSSVEVWINDVLIENEKLSESNPWNLQINLVKEANGDDLI